MSQLLNGIRISSVFFSFTNSVLQFVSRPFPASVGQPLDQLSEMRERKKVLFDSYLNYF